MCRMVFCVYNFHLISLIILFNNVYSVPSDYCLHPLNRSDCNMTPTPVFSYYKPGSRCEIQFWRGCPTFNKFPDEALCSHYCIGKLYRAHVDENTVIPDTIVYNFTKDSPDPCQGELNTSNCIKQETKVFTFYNNSCVETTWWGCETDNIFDDESSCKDTCVKEDDLKNWIQQLQLLLPEEVLEIDKIIDNVIETENTTSASTYLTSDITTTEIVTSKATSTKTVQITTESTTTSEVPTTTSEAYKTTMSTDAPSTTSTSEAPKTTTTTEAPKTTTTTEAPTTTTTTEATTTTTTTEASTTTTTMTTTTEPPGDADEVITT